MKDRTQVHNNWKTAPEFYEKLNAIHSFDFDPCPWQHDMSWDGLERMWGKSNFVNPPYSLKLKTAFVRMGIEGLRSGRKSVFLLPVSTSTALYHQYILKNQTQPTFFLDYRIPFIGIDSSGNRVNYHLIGEATDLKRTGQFDNMIITFDPSHRVWDYSSLLRGGA